MEKIRKGEGVEKGEGEGEEGGGEGREKRKRCNCIGTMGGLTRLELYIIE